MKMKEMTLTYQVCEVAEKVEQLTYMLASSHRDSEGNMRIADFVLASDNSVVMERILPLIVAELNKALAAYIDEEKAIAVAEGVITLPLRVVDSCPAAIQATLTTQLEEFIINYICSEWLMTKQLDEATTLLGRAQYLLTAIQGVLNRRTTPIRRPRTYL